MLKTIGLHLKIDTTKIKEELLFKSNITNSIYLDCTTFINIENTDQYGNNCFITQDLPIDQREQNKKGNIIGNGKIFYRKSDDEKKQDNNQTNDSKFGDDDIPF